MKNSCKNKAKSRLFDPRYTGRFKQTKAITFEMEPYGNTEETIRRNEWLNSDAGIIAAIKETMVYFDDHICACTSSAMDSFNWDWNNFDPEDKKSRENLSKKISDAIAREMCIKNSKGMLSKSYIFETLPTWLRRNGKHEAAATLESFSNFLPIYNKLLVSKTTAIDQWIPERIIENFTIYSGNMSCIAAFLGSEYGEAFVKDFHEESTTYSTFSGYSLCMSSSGIGAYNDMIRGVSGINGIIKKGLINRIEEANMNIKTRKLKTCFFAKPKKLYKQILAPADKQFTIGKVNDDEELITLLTECLEMTMDAIEDVDDYFAGADAEDLAELLFDGKNAHGISHVLTGDHGLLPSALINRKQKEIEAAYAGKKLTEKQKRAKEKKLQDAADAVNKEVYSLRDVMEVLPETVGDKAGTVIASLARHECDAISAAAEILGKNVIAKMAKIKGDEASVKAVREFFDSCTKLRRTLKTFVPANKTSRVSVASDKIRELADELHAASNSANNKARNYLTKKVNVSAPKQQIFFGNPARLNGCYWNGMEPLSSVNNSIVKMDDMYYLFMLTKNAGTVSFPATDAGDETVGLLTVNRMQDPKRNIPAWLWPRAVKEFFETHPEENVYCLKAKKSSSFSDDVTYSRKAYEIYRDGLFMTSAKESLGEEQWKANLTLLIKTYIKAMKAHATCAHLKLEELRDPEEYTNFGEFCSHVASIGTCMEWTPVPRAQILSLVEEGRALMFLVKNQNMYRDVAHGYEYDHPKTSYAELFLASLSDENFRKINLRLNSRPTFWFRPASVPYRIAHKQGERLLNKNTLDGRYIPDTGVRTELKEFVAGRIDEDELSEEAKDLAFVYDEKGQKRDNLSCNIAKKDLVYKESLTRDMYQVTFTIEINAGVANDSSYGLIDDAKEFEADNGNIVSITRNNNDLLYYVLSDKEGKVLNEGSLNTIDNVDYKLKLMLKTNEKERGRKEWSNITSADEIKSTFMRKAVHTIKKMAVENNARIVVEYAGQNKRSRNAMFDDQIYGKFVEQLKNGMSNYTDPEVTRHSGAYAPGGRLNPLQLSFTGGTGWNAGFVQEESGAYSSTMCPETGFVNAFQFNSINTVHEKKEFFKKFKDISSVCEDGKVKAISFTFDYEDFVKETSIIPPVTLWTVKGTGERFVKIPDHKYASRKNIAEYICEVLGVNEDSGNIVNMIDGLTGTQVNDLFNVFKTIMFGYHTEKTENTRYHYMRKDSNGGETISRGYVSRNAAMEAAIEAGLGDMKADVMDLIVETGGKALYISPVTGNRYDSSQHACLMLAEKHRFFATREFTKADEPNVKWLEYKQTIAS